MEDIWMGVLETFVIFTFISVCICASFEFIFSKLISHYFKSPSQFRKAKEPPEYLHDLDKIIEIIRLITPIEKKAEGEFEGNYNGRKVLFTIYWAHRSFERYTALALSMQSNRTDFPPRRFFTLRHYQPTAKTFIYNEWVTNNTILICPPFHNRQESLHEDRTEFLQKIQKHLNELSDACDVYEKALFNKR